MNPIHQIIELLRNELGVVLSSTLARLLLAAILGGIIGLERQLRHKPAGSAHEYVHLFRLGDVHGSIAATRGDPGGQRAHRGADHHGHRLHRRGLDFAHARRR